MATLGRLAATQSSEEVGPCLFGANGEKDVGNTKSSEEVGCCKLGANGESDAGTMTPNPLNVA